MRSRLSRARVRGMPEASRTIGLEIDGEQGPLHGRVVEAGGVRHEFEGWLGLLTVLGNLFDRPASGAEQLVAVHKLSIAGGTA